MSLIEQAAKRLEELRRAGAELPDEPASRPAADSGRATAPERVPDAGSASSASSTSRRSASRPRRRRRTGAGDALAERRRTPASRGPRRNGARRDRPGAPARQRASSRPTRRKSQIADEFRVIKRPIIRNAHGAARRAIRNGNLVMVTSALPGEGKTFTAVNLAMSMAMEFDNTVLLVDGDVAHPVAAGAAGHAAVARPARPADPRRSRRRRCAACRPTSKS